MKFKKILVRAIEGRLARNGPQGSFIPHDRDMLVSLTPYIDRLLNVHKDIKETSDPERPLPRSTKPKPGKLPVEEPADPPQPPVAIED